jgi:hypothetical protein
VIVRDELKALGKKLSEKLLSDGEMLMEWYLSSGGRTTSYRERAMARDEVVAGQRVAANLQWYW